MTNASGNVETSRKDDGETDEQDPSCEYWQKFSFFITQKLSQFFYRLGYNVALHPWRTIFFTLMILASTSLGFYKLQFEQNALKTFVSAESKLSRDTQWLFDTSGEVIRYQSILLRAENVLTPEVMRQVAYITNLVIDLSVTSKNNQTVTYDDLCLKIPNIYFYTQEDDEDYTEPPVDLQDNSTLAHPFEAIVDLDTDIFCDSYSQLDKVCIQDNLMAMWNLDADVIDGLTVDDILRTLNRTRISPLTGQVTDFTHLLGGVKRNASGYIVSAEAIILGFLVNNSVVEDVNDEGFNIFGNKEWVSAVIHRWEGAFNNKMRELQVEMQEKHNITLYYSASRSFFDVSDELWAESMLRLAFGFVAMFIYLQFVLMNYHWLEIRLFVGICGLISVGMAMISGFGIGSAVGYVMSNTQLSIPFIVIGLGVDDMFVIMSSLDKVRKRHKHRPLPEIMGLTMQHSGTSITITSLTNVVVFLVGMKTTVPALSSYYFTAAPCIFMTYFFVVTFFVAIVTLDEQRIAARRNFLIPCIVHDENTSCSASDDLDKPTFLMKFLEYVYRNFIFTKVGKVVGLIPVIVLTLNSLYHVTDVQRTFSITAVINRDSYYYKYLEQKTNLYPNSGYEAIAMMGRLNYSVELPKIFEMTERLERESEVLYDVNSWVRPFHKFVATFYGRDISSEVLTDTEWNFYLSQFLFSSAGGAYNFNFKFATPIECGRPAPEVKLSTIDFKFRPYKERDKYIPIKKNIDKIVEDAHLDSGEGYSAIWSRIFFYWIPNSAIDSEILRNLSLGWLSVAVCTSILIANMQMCFWIQACVLLTMIDVIGFMDRWDLPYDYITLVALQMAIGLCVDYAVHVGHMFMTMDCPDKEERAIRSVLEIGPAVFHGGMSTLLMFGAMATVNSYSSQAFIKVFFLVIVFGLYHGLIFLPIVLSWIGPKPYVIKHGNDTLKSTTPLKPADIFTINASTNQLHSFSYTDTIDIRL